IMAPCGRCPLAGLLLNAARLSGFRRTSGPNPNIVAAIRAAFELQAGRRDRSASFACGRLAGAHILGRIDLNRRFDLPWGNDGQAGVFSVRPENSQDAIRLDISVSHLPKMTYSVLSQLLEKLVLTESVTLEERLRNHTITDRLFRL